MNQQTQHERKKQHGQALVVLLFYMVISITLVTAAVALTISNSFSAMQEEEGGHAQEIAESGVENALLRLLRDTMYSGEVMQIGNGNVTTTVSGSTTKTILSVGEVGNFTKTIQVTLTITNGILSIQSWQEI